MKDIDTLISNAMHYGQNAGERGSPAFENWHKRKTALSWIGCSDSRVPAERLTGLEPGELCSPWPLRPVISHRLNCLSVVQYMQGCTLKLNTLLSRLREPGCGSVQAAVENPELGLINNWLLHIRDIWFKHSSLLGEMPQSAVWIPCVN